MGQCVNSTIINAPVDKVWALLRDFHGIAGWSPTIESCEVVGSAGANEIGARRKLNGAIDETLVGLDDLQHSMTYTIDKGPGPLEEARDYVGLVTAKPVTSTGETYVEWSSRWLGNDGPVAEFCDPIYRSLLADLKKASE